MEGGGSSRASLKDCPIEPEARGVLPDRKPLMRLAAWSWEKERERERERSKGDANGRQRE